MELMDHQLEVIPKLSSGKILYGGTGAGKGATVLGYYMREQCPRDLFVITTAKKRDSLDWEREAVSFGIGTEPDATVGGVIRVDSWNNIGNYTDVSDAFFVFDEQRLVGHGAWVRAFLKIAKKNDWLMLSATPGDSWMDYAPVFIANGFYKHITDFKMDHVVYESFVKFPKIKGYLGERKLQMLRNEILVEMPYVKDTERMLNYMYCSYDTELVKRVWKDRWHVFENRPIKDAAECFRVMKQIINSDWSRLDQILWCLKSHPKLIVFYNFNYELDILRTLAVDVPVYEYNGHVKDPVPEGEKWVYLVQYVAGAEAWNCTSTDAMVLYSLTYSYKNFEQAQGRIDRLDTKFTNLYYYILVSHSIVDRAIMASLERKENFNERKWMRQIDQMDDCGSECGELCQI